MVLPHLRADNVGSVISVAADIDPYDTRLQETCLDCIVIHLFWKIAKLLL